LNRKHRAEETSILLDAYGKSTHNQEAEEVAHQLKQVAKEDAKETVHQAREVAMKLKHQAKAAADALKANPAAAQVLQDPNVVVVLGQPELDETRR
jgi:hypothetical protein